MAAIRAIGMVSSLGLDWRTACAAARAGLRRAAPVEGLETSSEVDGEDEQTIGHAVTLLTHGFEGGARLLRLLAGGLQDLLLQAPQLRIADAGVGYFLVLPPRDRVRSSPALGAAVMDDGSAPHPDADAEAPAPPDFEFDRSRLLACAAELAGIEGVPLLSGVWEDDDVSALVALDGAARLLDAGNLRGAVVLAVDSLLSAEVVEWLEQTSRLKSSGMPVGLEPGEACVALWLDNAAAPGVTISGTSFAIEPQALADATTSTGDGTARTLLALAERFGLAQRPALWLLSDHNGEPYRANDLALAIVRARTTCPAFGAATVSYPALSFGDVGVARPLVAVCLAVAAFERGWAPAGECVVLAVGTSRRRAALLIAPTTAH